MRVSLKSIRHPTTFLRSYEFNNIKNFTINYGFQIMTYYAAQHFNISGYFTYNATKRLVLLESFSSAGEKFYLFTSGNSRKICNSASFNRFSIQRILQSAELVTDVVGSK